MYKGDKILAIVITIIFGTTISCNRKQDSITRKQLFDLNWKFCQGNISGAYQVDFNDQLWRNLDLPHDWSMDAELTKMSSEYLADSISAKIGWYRKHFTIPEDWTNKNIVIDFEGICDQSEIFVNGVKIANPGNGISSFQKILNPYLNSKRKNVIAVRVNISTHADDSFQTESGIYNHVWLIIKDPVDLKNKKYL